LLPPPISTLLPYTTLFRSVRVVVDLLLFAALLRLLHHVGGALGVLGLVDQRGRLLLRLLGERLGLELLLRHALVHQRDGQALVQDRKSTRLNSSHVKISYA